MEVDVVVGGNEYGVVCAGWVKICATVGCTGRKCGLIPEKKLNKIRSCGVVVEEGVGVDVVVLVLSLSDGSFLFGSFPV